jgi:hypothetical protein
MLRPIWALLQGLDAERVKVAVQPLAGFFIQSSQCSSKTGQVG